MPGSRAADQHQSKAAHYGMVLCGAAGCWACGRVQNERHFSRLRMHALLSATAERWPFRGSSAGDASHVHAAQAAPQYSGSIPGSLRYVTCKM